MNEHDQDRRPGETPHEALARRLLEASDDFTRDHARQVLARYRPTLEAEFGQEISRKVMDDSGFEAYVADVSEDMDPDEAAYAAAAHMRDHSTATAADAYAAIREQARES